MLKAFDRADFSLFSRSLSQLNMELEVFLTIKKLKMFSFFMSELFLIASL